MYPDPSFQKWCVRSRYLLYYMVNNTRKKKGGIYPPGILKRRRSKPWEEDGPWPLKSTGRQGCFLNSTCEIGPIDMRHGFQKYSDMRQGYFLKSTGDIALNKWQRHATLAFLKIDRRHGDPPSRAPRLEDLARAPHVGLRDGGPWEGLPNAACRI